MHNNNLSFNERSHNEEYKRFDDKQQPIDNDLYNFSRLTNSLLQGVVIKKEENENIENVKSMILSYTTTNPISRNDKVQTSSQEDNNSLFEDSSIQIEPEAPFIKQTKPTTSSLNKGLNRSRELQNSSQSLIRDTTLMKSDTSKDSGTRLDKIIQNLFQPKKKQGVSELSSNRNENNRMMPEEETLRRRSISKSVAKFEKPLRVADMNANRTSRDLNKPEIRETSNNNSGRSSLKKSRGKSEVGLERKAINSYAQLHELKNLRAAQNSSLNVSKNFIIAKYLESDKKTKETTSNSIENNTAPSVISTHSKTETKSYANITGGSQSVTKLKHIFDKNTEDDTVFKLFDNMKQEKNSQNFVFSDLSGLNASRDAARSFHNGIKQDRQSFTKSNSLEPPVSERVIDTNIQLAEADPTSKQ